MKLYADYQETVMISSSEKSIVKDMRLASLEVLQKTARDVFEEKTLVSNLDNNGRVIHINGGGPEGETDIVKVDEEDLVLGRVIGRGAFCVVTECSFLNPLGMDKTKMVTTTKCGSFRYYLGNIRRAPSRGNSKIDSNGASSSNGSASATTSVSSTTHKKNSLHGKKHSVRYVMKHLSSDLKRLDKLNFLKGTVDLAMEARFLGSLDHENIICLKGESSTDAFSDGYFIVLEKLNETLGKRVKRWMDMDRQCKGITGVFTGSKRKAQRLQTERMIAARDLVRGMEYLHDQKIVFRDLKPDNIGFNYEGILKLFDFGLAKELREDERVKDDLYKMTGCTGSIRYMSPENIGGKPYNLKTDVYSWSMIMWNILALEPPFALYTEQMIIDRVCSRGYRPKIFSSWSQRMSLIISQSWSPTIEDRPTFSEIAVQLQEEMKHLAPEDPEISPTESKE